VSTTESSQFPYTFQVIEREVKLRFESADAARAAVAQLGATLHRGRRLQDDRLLDRDEHTLRSRGCALRIRRDGDVTVLTFKGPVMPGSMKMREEIETSAGDADVLTRIFEELGFEGRFRYQKYREDYRLAGVMVSIDETPIGTFVELEGDEAAIADAAARLGRGPADYVLGSYRTLFLEYRQAQGIVADGGDEAADDMVFNA
jgi:adenylate cyclase class 2